MLNLQTILSRIQARKTSPHLRRIAIFVSTLLLVGGQITTRQFQGLAQIPESSPSFQIVQRQQMRSLRVQDVWRTVYEQLPDLPKENEYVSVETGEVASEDTLVGRLIRYHMYVKGRSPLYRFDWKLTLADYLGVNEVMSQVQYPGAGALRENPIEGDRQAIQNLNRVQREALVNILVSIVNPNSSNSSSSSGTPTQQTSPQQQPSSNSPALPDLPQPGDAQLLQP